MRSKLFLCAEDIILNAHNDSSAVGIFENCEVHPLPLVIPKIAWLALLERDISELSKKTVYLVLYIDHIEIYRMTVNVDFGSGLSNKCIAKITNLSIPNAGLFRSTLKDGKEILASYDFKIDPMKPK